ncbi:FtsX-like permease family protein [Mucilaginibacter achroorhodeus]|uniref:FtsX-like permease family protein n=1 Tax=Mucilaginibacter achroorhodeus TaxID=2599294 RepID=A0A563U3Y2_9SPHI|nr:ABC transporter permease [Mucilaginibacter achroorhodeus]TWR26058.1 FtsX-like permease family protein [Mucilaginibacter achroorhodeus]
MIKNYLKIALRGLWKNKGFTFINLFGLTIGLCSCLLIGVYIMHELNYDNTQTKGNRIARMIMEYNFGKGESKKGNYTSVKVAPTFKRNFPEIESAVRMLKSSLVIGYKDKLLTEKSFMYADSSFFKIFSFDLIKGDKNTALDASHKVLLTQSTAKRYFGDEDPIGKALKVGNDSIPYQISGVMADCPSNSQIKFDFLASFSSLNVGKWENSYWNANFTTYLLLKDERSIATLQAKIKPFMAKEMTGEGASVSFDLEPFKSIHLHSPYDGFEPNNNIKYIYVLEAIALLILVIGCFTYVNLNTARSMERAKEVGVRKVIGADKSQLFWQFIGESVIVCVIAAIISFIAAILLLPAFNNLTDRQLPVEAFFTTPFVVATITVVLAVSFFAGLYPALVLTNFQPVKVLKGAFKNTASGQFTRKALIVFQFSVSVILIASTVIIQKQLAYIRNKNLGYERERVIILPFEYRMNSQLNVMRNEFKADKNILNVSRCVDAPVKIDGGYNMRNDQMPESQQIAVTANPIDQEYIKTTGLHIIAGTDLTEQDVKDASNENSKKNTFHFILNEAAARELGWTPQQAIGKRMFLDSQRPGYVKAVVKDFNFESLHNNIKPLVLFPEDWGSHLLIKISGQNIPQTIANLESKWKALVPYRPFEYRFMDDDFNNLYKSELRLGNALNIFAAIAIALACMGLLGLSAYMAKQRIKEIGIRKVLGASITDITTTLSASFIKLVLISIAISLPVAWYATGLWLQGFAYRANVSALTFIVAGGSVVIIAIITVSFQSIKAALANPVKSLKNE